jgi:hypothetical protein
MNKDQGWLVCAANDKIDIRTLRHLTAPPDRSLISAALSHNIGPVKTWSMLGISSAPLSVLQLGQATVPVQVKSRNRVAAQEDALWYA